LPLILLALNPSGSFLDSFAPVSRLDQIRRYYLGTMAACHATLPLPSASRTPAQAQELTKRGTSRVCSARLRPQSVRALFRINDAPKNTSASFTARARLGGDGDVDFNGDPVAEDFYSVLGLVRKLAYPRIFF
jgi:hypothetical protein